MLVFVARKVIHGRSTRPKVRFCWQRQSRWLSCCLLCVQASLAIGQSNSANDGGARLTSADVMTEAAARLARHRSVVANMRQRINIYGRRLVGSGSYQQLQTGTDLLYRLELKVPVGETLASLLQVCDGRYLWTYRVLPDKKVENGLDTSSAAVDLNRVREISSIPRLGTAGFAVGGLPGLLQQTARLFEFRAPQQSMLHGTPVWVLNGKLRMDVLHRLQLGDSAGEGGETLEHVPDMVTIALGMDDLFPYQIEFRKKQLGDSVLGAGVITRSESRPLMTLELFEVQLDVPVNPDLFSFRPPNSQIDDMTEQFLANQQLSSELEARANQPDGRQ